MTRKEELRRVAECLALSAQNHDHIELADMILTSLLQVEREVWGRVNHYYSHQIHHDMDDYPDKFVTWLRAQQQELT